MQQTQGDNERELVTMRESERHVATPWDRRDSEKQQATIGDSEKHAGTLWDRKETVREGQQT